MATLTANTAERLRARMPPFLVGLLVCWFADAHSESPLGTVVGRVTQEGRPAAFANVVVIGTRIGTQARDDGWFQLDKVPGGSRVIQFQAFGCVKTSISVDVEPGITDTISVDPECPLVVEALRSANLAVVEQVHREPYDGAEYPSPDYSRKVENTKTSVW